MPTKCILETNEVQFLDYIIFSHALQLEEAKVKAIQKYTQPLYQTRSRNTTILAPLNQLMRESKLKYNLEKPVNDRAFADYKTRPTCAYSSNQHTSWALFKQNTAPSRNCFRAELAQNITTQIVCIRFIAKARQMLSPIIPPLGFYSSILDRYPKNHRNWESGVRSSLKHRRGRSLQHQLTGARISEDLIDDGLGLRTGTKYAALIQCVYK